MKALFDTNILVDHLNGIPDAALEFARHENWSISIVTWMEVLAGAQPEGDQTLRRFLSNFGVVDLDGRVAERVVTLRKTHRIKLPDAIIRASADIHSMLLVTRNEKDFAADMPGIRIPYRLKQATH